MCPAPLTLCADGALAALASLAPPGSFSGLCGSQLLAERAAIFGHTRRGAVSPGGSCHLLRAADGHVALNLARGEDWQSLTALFEDDAPTTAGEWAALEARTVKRSMHDLVERGRLLGLAIAPLVPVLRRPEPWQRTTQIAAPASPLRARPRVLELASLWAGPLCGHLLQMAGAEVIKIESSSRPDGARSGPPAFFDLLNAGKHSVALDLTQASGRAQLRALMAAADIVIEGSRPRALRQLGIGAETLLQEHPGLSWISISGYGRGKPREDWIAYGDDAGVAAGLSQLMVQASGQRMFCGDAIADPLTGLHAAFAAWASYLDGGGRLISVALRDVVAHCLRFDLPADVRAIRDRNRNWTALLLQTGCEVHAPRARVATAAARPLGADTAAALSALNIAC
jgi:hypothetical protein